MSRACKHAKAALAATGAFVADRTGASVAGSVRWCPECGAIRAETFVVTGIVLGEWQHVGDPSVIATSQRALSAETQTRSQSASREFELERIELEAETERLARLARGQERRHA